MHYSGWPGLAIFALICSRYISRSHASSPQVISFQILLYALFLWFPWSTLLPFPSYFKFHNLAYLGVNVSTDYNDWLPQTTLNYHIHDLHNTQITPKNISRHPIDQSHPKHHHDHTTLHPTQRCLIISHVSKHYNKTGLTQHW